MPLRIKKTVRRSRKPDRSALKIDMFRKPCNMFEIKVCDSPKMRRNTESDIMRRRQPMPGQVMMPVPAVFVLFMTRSTP